MARNASLCAGLIAACAACHAWASTGPIAAERSADHMLDSFEAVKPGYDARARGKAVFELSGRPGIGRHGNRSLLVELKPSGEPGRNSLLLVWRFDPPADWSAYGGLSVWIQGHQDPPASITPVLFEADGASYWWRSATLQPRQEGQWQLIEMPFNKWTWSWEARKDPNGKLDLDRIRELRFEIRAGQDRPLTLGIDGLGLYSPRPAYAGPVLRLKWPKGQRQPSVRDPGQDYAVVVELRQLGQGQRANVTLTGKDYWGGQALSKTLSFEGQEGAPRLRQTVAFANDGPNYIGLAGTVTVAGQPVYRAESGVGCIKPMHSDDAKPNAESIFGIWVGGGGQRIGAKWDRQLMRISTVSKVGDQYQIKGLPPGQPRSKWGSPDQSRTVCFVTMAKWLSSKPDRADYQKWSPTSWDEYAGIVKFVVRGASQAGIKHYEVWNEPVPFAYWMGPMESVVKLHEVTYQAIKSVQPDAVVLGPCPYTFKWDFLEEFFKLGGGKWIDQVLMHTYDSEPPDVNLPANLRRLHQMMERFGLGDRDVYITEMGYGTPKHTESEQAQNLVRAFVYALSERVRVLMWHMLWDWQGVRDPDNYAGEPGHAIMRFDKSPRPAYIAYATMTRLLERAAYVGPVAGLAATQRGFEFRKRGKRILVLWDTSDRATTLRLRSGAKQLLVVNILGRESSVPPAAPGQFALTLTANPIYAIAPEESQ